jgi:hypothetical protein
MLNIGRQFFFNKFHATWLLFCFFWKKKIIQNIAFQVSAPLFYDKIRIKWYALFQLHDI